MWRASTTAALFLAAWGKEAAKETTRLRDEAERLRKEMEARREQTIRKSKEEARRILENARRESDSIVSELKRLRKEAAASQTDVNALRHKLDSEIDGLQEGLQARADETTKAPEHVAAGDAVSVLSLGGTHGTVLQPDDASGKAEIQVGMMKVRISLENLRLLPKAAPICAFSTRSPSVTSMGMEKLCVPQAGSITLPPVRGRVNR